MYVLYLGAGRRTILLRLLSFKGLEHVLYEKKKKLCKSTAVILYNYTLLCRARAKGVLQTTTILTHSFPH